MIYDAGLRQEIIRLTLTQKMTTAQVVETSVTVNNKSPIHTQTTQKIHCKLDFIIYILRNTHEKVVL